MMKKRSWRRFLALALALVAYGIYEWEERGGQSMPPGGVHEAAEDRPAARDRATADAGEQAILELYRNQKSGVMVEAEARVAKILRDDLEGSRHQRWIVELASGHTVLVSHNIDLAPRVPLGEGDLVRFRGQYEWNDRGGVVHWTHHDPRGRRTGGWIRHQDQEYR